VSRVKHFFDQLLPILWLRPESALWYSYMLAAVEDFSVLFESPSMEFGCMDGINTFLLLGGKIDERYDLFGEAKWHPTAHREASLKNDYYDLYDSRTVVPIAEFPHLKLDFGVDWKDVHLEKASRLNIYRSLAKIDLSFPKLDQDDNFLRTIWAPNLYWTPHLPSALREMRRVLRRDDGRLYTILPNISQLNYMIYKNSNEKNREWLKLIDRGRFNNVVTNGDTLEGWISKFSSNGLFVVRHKRFIPEVIARVYDIGFRPMFPVLLNMYDSLSRGAPSELQILRREWIARVQYLFSPLIGLNELETENDNCAWYIFEVSRA